MRALLLAIVAVIYVAATPSDTGAPSGTPELDPIVVGGNMLFNAASRERFYVKGITYGYDVDDSAEQYWRPAVEQMANLGVNTIRIYRVKPSVPAEKTSYDKFMAALANHSMYAVLAISPDGTPWNGHHGSPNIPPGNDGCTLERNNGPTGKAGETCYPPCLLTYGKMVISQFAKYSNVLAYIVANEVMNDFKTFAAAPCVKAYARDIKQYMRSCSNSTRQVPLMYAAADNGWLPEHVKDGQPDATELDLIKAQYLTCGNDITDGTIDMIGYNVYRWCNRGACEGNTAGGGACDGPLYSKLKQGLSIPIIFAEYGCAANDFDPLTGDQRDWTETKVLYNEMADTFSGGFAYAYGETGVNAFSFFNSDGKPKAIGQSKNKAPSGSPGYTKVCTKNKATSPDAGVLKCGADNYATQLKAADPKAIIGVLSPDVCHLLPPSYVKKPVQCPDLKKYGLEAVDLKTIPTSREGLDTQDKAVSCAVRSLTKQEADLEHCKTLTTATPTTVAPTKNTPSPTNKTTLPPVTAPPTNTTPSPSKPNNNTNTTTPTPTTPNPKPSHTPAPTNRSTPNHTAVPSKSPTKPPANHTPTPGPSGGGGGAGVAIAVGVGAAVVIALGVGCYCFTKRNARVQTDIPYTPA